MSDFRAWVLGWLLCLPWWANRRQRGRGARRGTITVEYIVLLSTVAVGLALVVAGLGVPLVRNYLKVTEALGLPFP